MSSQRKDPSEGAAADQRLCRVAGLNQNYTSRAGTPYHIQVEDRGPVTDALTGRPVRRLNVIVYANYGDPSARIVYGCDHDYPDVRTADHDAVIAREVQKQAAIARALIEERERAAIERLKRRIREYHVTKSEPVKRELEETNALFPFLFSLAWRELKNERTGAVPPPAGAGVPISEAHYPLDNELRALVLDIERTIAGIGRDVTRLRAEGRVDEAMAEAAGKAVAEARMALTGRDNVELNARRLTLLRDELLTTWRRVHAQVEH